LTTTGWPLQKQTENYFVSADFVRDKILRGLGILSNDDAERYFGGSA